MSLDKHFTATTYILQKSKPRVLLHFHEKLQTWLPPGGHLEKNETPFEAAIREVHEETGLKQSVLEVIPNGESPRKIDDRAEILEMPHYLLSELIETNHYHLDWIFYAKIDIEDFNPNLRPEEFRWFATDDLEKEDQIFENVKDLALKGLENFH